ncbi:ABC transporter permease [Fodinicurvata sediminis]|uniref:ABC transporter permease n=1 Tax=Fodinicurvata sediminis TaxID=1121832 RepID=UPI0003B44CD5|nr:ABC transporter permease [Fodinicurvata sediminis]
MIGSRSLSASLPRTGALPWLAALFVALTLFMGQAAPLFEWLLPGLDNPVYDRHSFPDLVLDHVVLVAASSLISVFIGVSAGIFATRPVGQEFKPVISAVSAIGQTFPPAAVLAVVAPLAGFGFKPALVALALYGLLPIVQNTMAGLETVPSATLEAARGMGLSKREILTRVELPLAMRVITAGIRVSVIVNIGTATIASTVGARSLGTPIISGLVSQNVAYVLQGAILVALLAIVTDLFFERLERFFSVDRN